MFLSFCPQHTCGYNDNSIRVAKQRMEKSVSNLSEKCKPASKVPCGIIVANHMNLIDTSKALGSATYACFLKQRIACLLAGIDEFQFARLGFF